MYPDKYHRLVGTQAKRRVSPASEAWGLMFRLLQQSKRRFGAIASEFELSPPQVHALRLLDPDEPKPMSELAERLHCDNSNVTGIVDRLEDRGRGSRPTTSARCATSCAARSRRTDPCIDPHGRGHPRQCRYGYLPTDQTSSTPVVAWSLALPSPRTIRPPATTGLFQCPLPAGRAAIRRPL